MMITDGQVLAEGWKNNLVGMSVVLGSGTPPVLDTVYKNCKNLTSNMRLLSAASLSTYLKTTLGLTINVDVFMSEVTDIVYAGSIISRFSLSTATPTVLVSGTPTWGIAASYYSGTLANGAASLGSGLMYQRAYLFSVGLDGSGSDMTIPAPLVAGYVFRMRDLTIPISNVVKA